MSNEPKRPSVRSYPDNIEGLAEFVIEMESYADKLEAEVERLKSKLKNKEIQLTAEMNMRNSAERKLTQLQSDLDRCKADMLGAEELASMAEWIEDTDWEPNCDKDDLTEEWKQAITAFRASQQPNPQPK